MKRMLINKIFIRCNMCCALCVCVFGEIIFADSEFGADAEWCSQISNKTTLAQTHTNKTWH